MPTSKRLRVSEDDPLTRAIAPPSYETPTEREERIAAEQEAKRVSDAIDEELNRQRISEKKGPKAIKILLLGALLLLFNSRYSINHLQVKANQVSSHVAFLPPPKLTRSLQANRQRSKVSPILFMVRLQFTFIWVHCRLPTHELS